MKKIKNFLIISFYFPTLIIKITVFIIIFIYYIIKNWDNILDKIVFEGTESIATELLDTISEIPRWLDICFCTSFWFYLLFHIFRVQIW